MAGQFPPTPYVNAGTLVNNKEAVGKTVRLIGQMAAGSGRAQIEAPDGRTVNVIRSRDSPPYNTKFVCITGVVQPDGSISEGSCEDFGDNFNLANFNRTIELMQNAPNLFYTLASP